MAKHMNKSNLKKIIQETIQSYLDEESKKETSNKKSGIPQGALSKLNPTLLQKPTKQLELPTSSKFTPKPQLKSEAGLTSESETYSEEEEIKIINQIDELTKKLLKMHNKATTNTCKEATYKQVSKNETDVSSEKKDKTIQTNPKVTENHKVQARSSTTVKDVPQNPNNIRNPQVPS